MAAHYRVRAGRDATGLGGSSLGGLVSLFLGLRYPRHFGRLAAISPSVWWNQKSILAYLSERAAEVWPRPRLWLDMGDQEGHGALRDADLLAEQLQVCGWRAGDTMHFERVAGGTHDESSWATRVRPMLRFLFPTQRA
jgi:predicted alpha/beta superfamily hydrolase